jgi:serine/threonine-protein kinase RsbW
MATEPSSQIVLDAQLAQLPQLEHWVHRLAGQFAWPPSLVHRIDLCLTELVTNVISYGYPDGRAGAVSIRLWAHAGQIVVRIDDDGTAFDPTSYVLPGLPVSLADASGDGRGIRLVRHFATKCGTARRSGNQLTLYSARDPDNADVESLTGTPKAEQRLERRAWSRSTRRHGDGLYAASTMGDDSGFRWL